MSDLLSRLKSMSANINNCTDAEIQFLKNSELSTTLDRAFNELYRIHPKNPVLFLSKWLMRESRAKELSKKYQEDEQIRSKLEKLLRKREKETNRKTKERRKKKYENKR